MSPRFSLNQYTVHESHHLSPTAPACGSDVDAERISVRRLPDPAGVPAATTNAPWRTVPSIFVPESYEPKYAYPLIVWILDPASGEHELCRLMAQVSTRNYFGVSLRTPLACEKAAVRVANEAADDAADDATDDEEQISEFEQQLLETVLRLRHEYHLHSERIFLAGFAAAGTLALRLGLRRPEWFAGMAALAGQFPEGRHPLSRFRDLRGKRVFLGQGENDRQLAAASMSRTSRLLHSAGMRVCSRKYEAGHEITRPMLTDIDRWVMREIYEPAAVI